LRNDIREVNRPPTINPTRTSIIEFDSFLVLPIAILMVTEITAKTNANNCITNSLPLKSIASTAPKAAPGDKPSVKGETSGLSKIPWYVAPLAEREVSISKAAMTRGNLI
jgi:hypothetical protein